MLLSLYLQRTAIMSAHKTPRCGANLLHFTTDRSQNNRRTITLLHKQSRHVLSPRICCDPGTLFESALNHRPQPCPRHKVTPDHPCKWILVCASAIHLHNAAPTLPALPSRLRLNFRPVQSLKPNKNGFTYNRSYHLKSQESEL